MKRQIAILALLIPVIMFAQENQTIRAFKAEKLYVRGLELYQNGNVRGAIQTFDEVISMDRNHGQVYQAKGDALYELGDYDQAIEAYTIAAQQYPDNANIRNSMGVAAGQMGMYRAAESYFLEALQIDPNLASARRNLERAQLKIREGSTTPDTGYAWEDDPVRPPYTNPGTPGSSGSSGWGNDPWDDPYGTGSSGSGSSSGSDSWADPYGSGSSGSGGWGDGYTNPGSGSTQTGNTDVFNRPSETRAPLKPWEREPRPQSKTTFSRDRGEIKVAYRTDPFVHVDQVKVTATSTLVILNVQSISRDPFLIDLAGPGSPEALMITDRQFSRVYRLKNVRLDGWPQDPYELRPGENKPIVMEFERIPDDMYFFHIIEGESPSPGSWDFYDVELVPSSR